MIQLDRLAHRNAWRARGRSSSERHPPRCRCPSTTDRGLFPGQLRRAPGLSCAARCRSRLDVTVVSPLSTSEACPPLETPPSATTTMLNFAAHCRAPLAAPRRCRVDRKGILGNEDCVGPPRRRRTSYPARITAPSPRPTITRWWASAVVCRRSIRVRRERHGVSNPKQLLPAADVVGRCDFDQTRHAAHEELLRVRHGRWRSATDANRPPAHDSEATHRVMVSMVMGRYAGWMPLYAGVDRRGRRDPHSRDPLRPRHRRGRAEGAATSGARSSASSSLRRRVSKKAGRPRSSKRRTTGHVEGLGGMRRSSVRRSRQFDGKETRSVVLGPSAGEVALRPSFDRVLATRFGGRRSS